MCLIEYPDGKIYINPKAIKWITVCDRYYQGVHIEFFDGSSLKLDNNDKNNDLETFIKYIETHV